MKNQTFHFEIEDILTQFASAMDDIIVRRYNKDREVTDRIEVNFVYSPKTRALYDIINKSQTLKLPCVAISLGGIHRASNRVFNKIDGSQWCNQNNFINLYQPVPIDITVNLSIISRFQSDTEQIISNFVPYIDPYFVISWKWPDKIENMDMEIRSVVKWNENINISYPQDFAADTSYWTSADTSFTIESWMFKNKPADGKTIYNIECNFSSVSGLQNYNIMKSLEDIYHTEQIKVSGIPICKNVYPVNNYGLINTDFNIQGQNLLFTQKLYLSSFNWNMFNTNVSGDFMANVSYITGNNQTGISGIELKTDNWQLNNNDIIFNFTPVDTGVFDIILESPAGYNIMTSGCTRPTLNPYKPGTQEYNNYIEYQLPCISGIKILNI